jgi:predicted Zn finger-like uncharacterized protein
MNIRCHGCGRHFRVRQDRLPAQGARTRCPRCDEVLIIAPPTAESREPATTTPANGNEDLFELPVADLEQAEEDLFAVKPPGGDELTDGQDAGVRAHQPDAPEEEAPAESSPRPGGLRGWLSRLFSRES